MAAAALPSADPRISETEYALLCKFRESLCSDVVQSFKVRAELYRDSCMVRFLRARRMDVAKALDMFRAHVHWRSTNDVDQCASWRFGDPARFKELYPKYFHRTDRAGNVVFYDRCGRLRLKELLSIASVDQMVQYFIQTNEYITWHNLCSDSATVRHVTTVIDCNGLGWDVVRSPAAFDYVKKISAVSRDHYPESSACIIIVNTPSLFPLVWKVVSAWLPEKTRQKTFIPNSREQRDVLLRFIPEENLPADLGGACDCKGRGCHLGCEVEASFQQYLRWGGLGAGAARA
eukprot:TRINITY_DN17831_c0_g1_i1.p1 TRINITY_DN17831_c0_g1~~TRINITY_DN17831_c0_g1_i1.p1  ORF type:complete len:326 (+),score=119.53 TRINITY_DN17831_c0_g1_i1:110-979(+)